MKRPLRIALWVVAVGAVAALTVGVGVGVVLWRHTAIFTPAEADAQASFASIRERFKGRPPLIEIKNSGVPMMDFRINRLPAAAPRQHVRHFQAIVWDSKGGRMVRSSVPVWWMRFSGNNLLARLGVPLGDFALTVEDIERYGPGIIIDFQPPGGGHMLVWVE